MSTKQNFDREFPTNPSTEAIVDYVEQNRLPLLGKSVLGAKAPKYFNLMTGVKGKTKLNIMDADPALQCGNTCGFDAANDTAFTQAEMNAIPIKVNMSFCDKNLLDTWANHEVRVAAGVKNMPFEEEWTDQIVAKVQNQLEKFIWQGTNGTQLQCADQVYGILDQTTIAGSPRVAVDSNTVYKSVLDLYAMLPETVQAADDVICFLSYKAYNQLVQEILSASHYHLDITNYEDGFMLPGTRVKVVPTQGIDGAWVGAIGRASNFFYGTDMRGDSETFDLWYSKDNREFRLAIEFVAGAAIAFPDEVGSLVARS